MSSTARQLMSNGCAYDGDSATQTAQLHAWKRERKVLMDNDEWVDPLLEHKIETAAR
jgi:hypothetical protein